MKKIDKEFIYSKNGITLISLVVTIIILLILAGISIMTLFGDNGLIAKTTKAKEEYKKQMYFEEINLEIIDETVQRIQEKKERYFIEDLEDRLKKKSWVENTIKCYEENGTFSEATEMSKNNVLIVNTKDGYEIIIDIYNAKQSAQIRDSFEKIGKKNKITYNSNGGNGNVEEQEIKAGFSISLAENNFSKEGYTFTGWCENKDGTGDIYAEGSKYTPKGNITLYAIWKKDVVTIHFEGKGATSGNMADITIGANQETAITKNKFIKTGYTFIGWTTKEEGTEVEYVEGSKISTTKDITLYAVWEELVTVSLVTNIQEINQLTNLQITATSQVAGLKKVEVTIGNSCIATYDVDIENRLPTSLSFSDMASSSDIPFNDLLDFNKEYEVKVTATGNTGKQVSTSKKMLSYVVSSAEDLKELARQVNGGNSYKEKTITQLGDIDLNGSSTNQTTVIGNLDYPFEGTYAGNYDSSEYCISHIKNIYINPTTNEIIKFGLFGVNKGTIKNIGIESGTITINKEANGGESILPSVGGIAGTNFGIIDKCYNKATIISNNENSTLGGIAGYNYGGTIRSCYNKGEVISNGSDARLGGIAGQNGNSGNIEFSYNRAKITGSSSSGYAGGLTGKFDGNTTISYCYTTGNVTTNNTKGLLFGYFGGTAYNYFRLSYTGISGAGKTDGGTGTCSTGNVMDAIQTETSMKSDNFLNLLGGTTYWKKDTKNQNEGYHRLIWEEN